MMMSPGSLARLLRGGAPLMLATLAQAQVTITADPNPARSRVACTLTVAHSDRVARDWRWHVVGHGESADLLEPIAPDKARFKTPVTLTERSFTVVAEDKSDPSVKGVFVLKVEPNLNAGGERSLVNMASPGAFLPSLRPFLYPFGGRGAFGSKPRSFTNPPNKIVFCDDAAMGPLDRCWIVSGRNGLEAYKVNGDPVRLPGFPYSAPPGRGEVPQGAPRIVFCEASTEDPDHSNLAIFALQPDGNRRFLAGSLTRSDAILRLDGKESAAVFEGFTDLALDRKGNAYVLEPYGPAVIRRIDPAGNVTTLCGGGILGDDVDGAGKGARFRQPVAMTVDPDTGDLYVGERQAIRKVTPDGVVTTVLGGGSTSALALDGDGKVAPLCSGRVPLDTRFRVNPRTLAMFGRELIICNGDGIFAFHLDTRRMALVVPKAAHQRMGPIHYLNPQLPPKRCAAIETECDLAITKDGMALINSTTGIDELELPDTPITTVMDPSTPESRSQYVSPPFENKADGKAGQGDAALDNLWPGPATETVVVRPHGTGIVQHWRTCAPGQTFTGQCFLESKGLTTGTACLNVRFADRDGNPLGNGKDAAGDKTPHEVRLPVADRTLLQAVGTAPQGAERVMFYLLVTGGTPRGVATFREVTFHQVPSGG